MTQYTPPSGPNQPSSWQQPPTSVPPASHYSSAPVPSDISGKKIAAGVLGIVLGSLGIHKFILGYTGTGLVMLLVTVLTLGILGTVMHIIGLIEGIIYLTKSDADFYQTYVVGKKQWF